MYEQSSSNTTNNRNNTITICFFLIQLFLIFKKTFPVLIIFIDEKMGTSSTVLYLAILSILSVLLSNFSNCSSPSGCLLVIRENKRSLIWRMLNGAELGCQSVNESVSQSVNSSME